MSVHLINISVVVYKKWLKGCVNGRMNSIIKIW